MWERVPATSYLQIVVFASRMVLQIEIEEAQLHHFFFWYRDFVNTQHVVAVVIGIVETGDKPFEASKRFSATFVNRNSNLSQKSFKLVLSWIIFYHQLQSLTLFLKLEQQTRYQAVIQLHNNKIGICDGDDDNDDDINDDYYDDDDTNDDYYDDDDINDDDD